ncbi:hypothetical protein [Mesorhizobium australicum]|uniref:Uncharacterized protein n=1 Tax=Mesorhizobium australicum TaxID=536018 RepID=A0A1X7MVH4_9HYPH|nr:hypothetical protein [Mesorhizobium australicum]SMH27933.1 hypothetical protein SAMN02982922_0678 [Mesorhizobium australicum]
MDTFTLISAAAPVARAIATLTAARKLPLRVDCLGEIEYPEDDPIYGSYTVPHTVELAQCASLAEAIACVERLARQDEIATGEDGALGFLPRLFIVRDGEHCLVLAGEPWRRSVRWCEPVASDGEARLIVEKASKLRGEASFEAGWDNHSTARSLRFRASALEGRLVDPSWRQAARAALFQAA